MTRKRNSDVVLEQSSSSTAIKGIVMVKAAAEQLMSTVKMDKQ